MPAGVDEDDAVGVAVKGQAEFGVAFADQLLQGGGSGRSAAGVDVAAVGPGVGQRQFSPRRGASRAPGEAAPLAQSTASGSRFQEAVALAQ